jgi:hypothetical protein
MKYSTGAVRNAEVQEENMLEEIAALDHELSGCLDVEAFSNIEDRIHVINMELMKCQNFINMAYKHANG